MKKLITANILLLTCMGIFALSVDTTPYGAELSFSPPSKAVYTDIYIDNGFIARLDSSQLSYDLQNLESDREYRLSVAYRDEENRDLDAEFATFRTGNWSGDYIWINETDDDNKGMVRTINIRVKTVHDADYGQYNEIYFVIDGEEHRIFPLYDFGTPVSWVDYESSTPPAISYRLSAERFNKSSIKPKEWKLLSMEVSPLSAVSVVETKAFGITVKCEIEFSFFLDDDGVRCLSFKLSGPPIMKSFFFYSPNGESEDGSFILRNIMDKEG